MNQDRKINKKKIMVLLLIIFFIIIMVLDFSKTFKVVNTGPKIEKITLKNGDMKETVLYADLIDNPDAYDATLEEANSTKTVTYSNYTDVFESINNGYFNISIDLKTKTVLVDGEEINFKDLLQISEEEADNLLSSTDQFKQNVENNLTGDVEYNEENISISNPYSTNNIGIITEADLENIDCGGNVNLVTKVAENTYYIEYDNALATKNGYETLKNNQLLTSVDKDKICFTSEEITEYGDIQENLEEAINSTSFTSDGEIGKAEPELGLLKAKLSSNSNNLSQKIKVAVVDTRSRYKSCSFKW